MTPSARPRSQPFLMVLAALAGALLARWGWPPPVAAQAADSGQRYVAVTGEYQQGVSLLYVLDQKNESLAVYEAKGGAENSRRVVLVAARDISLDTRLRGFNDESDYTAGELRKLFESRKIPTGEVDETGQGG